MRAADIRVISGCLVSDDHPAKAIFELNEARVADPAVVAVGTVALVKYVGNILNHECRGAELTMIVIPARILWITPVAPMDKVDARVIFLLSV